MLERKREREMQEERWKLEKYLDTRIHVIKYWWANTPSDIAQPWMPWTVNNVSDTHLPIRKYTPENRTDIVNVPSFSRILIIFYSFYYRTWEFRVRVSIPCGWRVRASWFGRRASFRRKIPLPFVIYYYIIRWDLYCVHNNAEKHTTSVLVCRIFRIFRMFRI